MPTGQNGIKAIGSETYILKKFNTLHFFDNTAKGRRRYCIVRSTARAVGNPILDTMKGDSEYEYSQS